MSLTIYTASSTPTSTLTWISWFCSLPGHEYFCEVSEEFIEDDFNLTGLNSMVPFWKEAMEMVLDVEPGVDTLAVRAVLMNAYCLQIRRGRFKNTRRVYRRVICGDAIWPSTSEIHSRTCGAAGDGIYDTSPSFDVSLTRR